MFNTFVYSYEHWENWNLPDLFLDQYARLPIGDVLVKIHMENKHAMFILMNSIILSLKPGLQYQLTKN